MPKKSKFEDTSDAYIVQKRLNHRPRKVLGYQTPYEVFFSKIAEWMESASYITKIVLLQLMVEWAQNIDLISY